MTELVLAFLSALPEASAANALQWTLRLLAVSLAIQSAELLRLAPAFSELGIWRDPLCAMSCVAVYACWHPSSVSECFSAFKHCVLSGHSGSER